ncbi:hypothetical protein NCS56_00580300 [Fusarium sp. Ph1]|nr:hypothetical protein NCS56_00580300 [Fusarium sp. Ph1]
MSDEAPSDKTLVRLYGQLSNKVLHAMYPQVWSKNGLWKRGYCHLENERPKHDKTIEEKEGPKWCVLFEKVFQRSVVSVMAGWTRIALSIVRSSSNPPNYGLDGMRQRATVAARARMKLYPQPSLLVVNARSNVSSRVSLVDASFTEGLRLLEAANQVPDTVVQLLVVGIDGFTADVHDLLFFLFPDFESAFPKLDNGIRYGQFHLDDVATAVQSNSAQGSPAAKGLVALLDHIVAGERFLQWTKHRSSFRVCPDSLTDSGVDLPLTGFITQQADDYQRIAIAFTRASSAPPTYGLEGMYVRAGAAAKAWSNLNPTSTSLIVAILRARVASKWLLEVTRSVGNEMVSILNVSADNMNAELLSVGLDGLTTDVSSFQWLQSTWGHRLRLRLVTMVSEAFPRTLDCFPVATNTIRYGEFELQTYSTRGHCRSPHAWEDQ